MVFFHFKSLSKNHERCWLDLFRYLNNNCSNEILYHHANLSRDIASNAWNVRKCHL